MRTPTQAVRRTRNESGFALIGIIVAVTLMLIALAAVAPRISTQIKRDREEELVHRGKQYVRAIQLYYRKFGRFPASVDQLENTNNVRYLRRKWPDPITGKEEWRLIRFGQAKPKQLPAWQKGGTGKGSSSTGAGISSAGSLAGAGGIAGPSQTGSSGQGPNAGSSGMPGAVNAADISKPLGGGSLGGGAIVGVSSTSEKVGLKEIDGKTKYNEWEFTYDPTLDPLMRGAGQAGGAGGLNGGTTGGLGGINPPNGPVRPGGAPTTQPPPNPTVPK